MKFKLLSKTMLLAFGLVTLLAGAALAAEMQYISREDLKQSVASGQNGYLILDVRKAADYEKGHIAGAVSADMDPAIGMTGSNAKGVETLKKVLKEKAGSENGAGKKMVILCYSGAKYAQKATDLLAEIGADASAVYTLKGGYKAWTADDGGDEYKKLMVSGKQSGSPAK